MTRISLSELRLIESLYKSGFTQKEIKLKVDSVRHEEDRFRGKGVSTNTISELSPRSKHENNRKAAIHAYDSMEGVLNKIMDCMGCDRKHAKLIYDRNIKPLCAAYFYDPNNANIGSIRYYSSACNSYLYYIFYTEGYRTFEEEEDDKDNFWTMKTQHEYKEILDGSLTGEDIVRELIQTANNEYYPYLLAVCVLKP